MPSIKAWSKDSERIFDRLCKDTVAYTKDRKLTQMFGIKCKGLIDDDFLDIAVIKKKDKVAIIKPPQIVIFPKFVNGRGLKFYFERLRL